MNPEMPQKPQDELEARLTALLLGELPHEQAAAMHQKLAQDAELAKLYERLKRTINLVRETLASPAAQTADQPTPPKLSAERRQKLLQQFKTVAPKEFVQPRRRAMPWLVPVGIAAAFVVILGGLFLPALSKAKSKGQSLAFRTWSLPEPAASVPLALPGAGSTRSLDVLNLRLQRASSGVQDLSKGTPIAPSVAETPLPAKPSGTAIVLPKATELAATTEASPVLKGVQAGFAVSAATRGFYDDSLGRAGSAGGGGGFGGFKGQAQSEAPATKDRLAGTVANDDFFAQSEGKDTPESGRLRQDYDQVHTFGEPSQQSQVAGRYGLTLGVPAPDAVGAPPPAVVPPPVATATPAEGRLSRADIRDAVPAPAPALTGPTSVEKGIEVAKLPVQTHGEDRTAGGLPAGGRARILSQQPTDVAKETELLRRSDLAWSDSSASAQPARRPEATRSGSGAKLFDTPVAKGSFIALVDEKAAKDRLQEVPAAGSALAATPASPVVSFGLTATPNQAGKSADTSYFNVVSASAGNLNYQWHYDASALPGLANSDGDKLPILGDVPVVGRYYRKTAEAGAGGLQANAGAASTPLADGQQEGVSANSSANTWALYDLDGLSKNKLGTDLSVNHFRAPLANITEGDGRGPTFGGATVQPGKASADNAIRMLPEEKVKSVVVADYDEERQKISSESRAGGPASRGENVHSVNVVGYVDVSKQVAGTNLVVGFPIQATKVEEYANSGRPSQPSPDANGVLSAARSPIVLPPEPAPSLAVQTGRGNKVQLLASAIQPGAAPDTLDDTRKQDEKVREAQKKVDELRVKLNISDAAASGDGPSPLMTADTLRKLESLRIESKAEYDREQSLADRLKVIGKEQGPEALAQAIPTAAPDPLLSSLLEQLNVAEQKHVALEKEQGPTHPDVLKSKAIAEDLHNKIKGRVDGIMLGLDARVSSMRSSIDGFEREIAQAYTNDVAQANRSRPYLEAKRNLEELQRFRQIEEMRAATKAIQNNQADVAPPQPAAPAAIPQPEVQTAENAFSTFSLNVSDVAFKLAAASLEKGLMPEASNVRSEEFINAFDYRDQEPPSGVPVAFAWERAQYPFAQNRDLLRFSIKTAALGRQPGRPLNLVLLLDNSGSMERADRVRIIREALRVLAEQLQPQDKLSVITFARTPRLFADGAPGSDAGAIAMALTELTPQGGTNLEDAMNLAYQTALRHYLANGVNRVVLLTDGAANLGNVDPEALKQKVEANRKQGIALDCFGIGWEGYNDDLLEVLSRNGDGRYGFVNTPEEAATDFAGQLAGALHVAASDVKVQVEFNPARVTAYRQIGYAKHQLTKQQFRDNTVDAAEIAAQEAGNALYVVEVNPRGDGPLATVRVRYKVPGTSDYHEHEWPVPYTGNAVTLEQASPAMRLAATASALSEWLVSSPYAGEVTPDRLLGYLSGVPEVYGADARPKKLEWMIRQAKSIAGK
jgi:Mg-chelatase subunit ChlD